MIETCHACEFAARQPLVNRTRQVCRACLARAVNEYVNLFVCLFIYLSLYCGMSVRLFVGWLLAWSLVRSVALCLLVFLMLVCLITHPSEYLVVFRLAASAHCSPSVFFFLWKS